MKYYLLSYAYLASGDSVQIAPIGLPVKKPKPWFLHMNETIPADRMKNGNDLKQRKHQEFLDAVVIKP